MTFFRWDHINNFPKSGQGRKVWGPMTNSSVSTALLFSVYIHLEKKTAGYKSDRKSLVFFNWKSFVADDAKIVKPLLNRLIDLFCVSTTHHPVISFSVPVELATLFMEFCLI